MTDPTIDKVSAALDRAMLDVLVNGEIEGVDDDGNIIRIKGKVSAAMMNAIRGRCKDCGAFADVHKGDTDVGEMVRMLKLRKEPGFDTDSEDQEVRSA